MFTVSCFGRDAFDEEPEASSADVSELAAAADLRDKCASAQKRTDEDKLAESVKDIDMI